MDKAASDRRRAALVKAADENPSFWQRVKDTASNTRDALAAGQVPIPFFTVGDRFENRPITVPKGDPVYIGMAGADPADWNDFADKFNNTNFTFQAKGPRVNTQMFRWFDRAEAKRAIERYAKDHPLYAFGESYGGRAIADAVNGQTNTVQSVVMYDPVSWGDFSAPTNTRNKAVNIQPKYDYSYDKSGIPGNVLATVGGRNHTVPNATTLPHELAGAAHAYSASPVSAELCKEEYGDKGRSRLAALPAVGSKLMEDVAGYPYYYLGDVAPSNTYGFASQPSSRVYGH